MRRAGVTRAPSMADVAARAGVSHQTVSRVLNTPDQVRPETTARVLAAIEELGFRRNLAARALVTRRTRLIGLATGDLGHFGPSQMVTAIEHAARLQDYATTVAVVPDARADTLTHALDHFVGLSVDGIVVIAPDPPALEAALSLAGRLPVVAVAAAPQAPETLSVVGVDQAAAGRLATEHLLALGHTRIAHIRGVRGWFDAEERVRGWREALLAAGCPVPEPVEGGWTAAGGYRAAAGLLDSPDRPTAIFAANDLVALGAMTACRERRLRVPDDIAVVGVDNLDGSDFYEPPLTTIQQPFAQAGVLALDLLWRGMDAGECAHRFVRPELVVRHSCGA